MQKCALVFKCKSPEGEQQTMKNYTVNSILNKFRNLRVVVSQEWDHTLNMGFNGSLGMQIYLPVEEKIRSALKSTSEANNYLTLILSHRAVNLKQLSSFVTSRWQCRSLGVAWI